MFKKKEEKQAAEETNAESVDQATTDSNGPKDSNASKDAKEPIDAKDSKDPNDPKPEVKSEPDWKALYAITLADFDNYKKRAARDREDNYRYAESDILKDILPTIDNLSLALANTKNKDDEFVKGVQMIQDGLLKALADHGAKPMVDLVGKELDPNFHEAIATLPDEKIEEGKISNVAKTGWTLNEKLLRAAQVVVSAGKAEQ